MTSPLFDRCKITADSIQKTQDGFLLSGARVTLTLPAAPKLFYRHGWQSWSLAAWIDLSKPSSPIVPTEISSKDEDPLYARSPYPISAWVGAVELADGSILLLGSLGLGGRVALDGTSLCGFYESGSGDWFLASGAEEQVFSAYADRLQSVFIDPLQLGTAWKNRHAQIPRVWCSWYSLYGWVTENSFLTALNGLDDLPFDVVQLDDGWELTVGDWEANKKFPSGMAALANRIRATGRTPGLWLAPFMVAHNSTLARQHPDWLLRDELGQLVKAGLGWNGITYALDSSHPEVLMWLEGLIRKVCGWGYAYLKLDFLYTSALPGKRKNDLPRETAYRQAMQMIRAAAGDAYLLGCGAPIIPSLGLCDGMRIGPDNAPYWINTPMSLWLNNPNHPGAHNALRTSLHRLWLQPLVHTDPDVVFFRSRHNALSSLQKTWLCDLSLLSQFKGTSDLSSWLGADERGKLSDFLTLNPQIEHLDRYRFSIDGRQVDFSPLIPLPGRVRFPANLAMVLGLYDMAIYEIIPAILESLKIFPKK